MRIGKGLVAPIAAALTASVLTVGITQAHVTVWPRESARNASELYTVRVPTEKDVPTVGVRVEFPADVTVSRFVPAPGWQRETTKDGTGKITSVTWSGGQLAPDELGLFSFQARNPQTGGSVSWTAYQNYADGSVVEWTGAPDAQYPASVVTLTDPAPSPSAMSSAASVGQVIAALNILDNSGFHELHDGAEAGSIPAGSLGRVQRAQAIAAATSWPAPMTDTARQLMSQLTQLRTALEANDVAAAVGPAEQVHELEHTLSTSAYAWLAEKGGITQAAPGHTTETGASGH